MGQLSRYAVACVAILAGFSTEPLAADRPAAINPSDVHTVRAFARGQGAVSANGACTEATCPARLFVTIDSGTPATLRGEVDVPIDVQREPDPFTLCRKFKGQGTMRDGELAVQLVGDLCQYSGIRFSISASMQVYANNAACACQDEFAAAGRLEMFGAVKTVGPQGVVPLTLGSVASFVGSAGRPAICCP